MVNCPAPPRIQLDRLVHLIAHTVDLVGEDDYYHGRRVGLIATSIARELGFDDELLYRVNQAGLLHDCGVSSTRVHRQLLNAIEWEGADHHCQVGHDLLKDYPPLENFAPIIRYHHSRWPDLQKIDIPAETALLANLIYLADRVDVLSAPFYDDTILLGQTNSIRSIINHFRGQIFAPQLVDAFLAASVAEAFWAPLMSREMIESCQANMCRLQDSPRLEWPDLMQAAEILARIVDAKSPFTQRHSHGVANLAACLAREMSFSEPHCEMIRVAGLLHDIGKLHISDSILEAPRALSQVEMSKMRTHSYMTYNILQDIGELDHIAHWAAQHHERLDGEGYPFHLKGEKLTMEARIISVADVYQALAQKRPYRDSMAPMAIFTILNNMVNEGKLDGDVVAIARANPLETDLAALML